MSLTRQTKKRLRDLIKPDWFNEISQPLLGQSFISCGSSQISQLAYLLKGDIKGL